ncbi:hypothetical protein, partial [Enterococcus faecalis]|uniref:hypothetical protein n=1 Tax=Enterococcus faecalis TaxID=1351 RepID=UPI001CE0CB95
IVIPPAIFFYYSTLFDSRFKTLQQNRLNGSFKMLSLPGPNSGTKVWVTIPCMKGEQYENITS